MTAISKAWVNVADSQVDPDSPLDSPLLTALRDDLIHLREWLGYTYETGAIQDHNHDGANSALVPVGPNLLRNGSFENGGTSGWTVTPYTGATVGTSTSNPLDGATSLAFTSTVLANGGGDAVSNEYIPISEGESFSLWFPIKASVANVSSKAEILWYDNAKGSISASTIFTSTNTPTTLTQQAASATAPANARFMRVKITGGVPATGSAYGTIYFDGLMLNGNNEVTQVVGDNSNRKATTAYCENFVNNDVGFNTVGSFALAYNTVVPIVPSGSTVVGSGLSPVCMDESGNKTSAGTLSGTWRNLGYGNLQGLYVSIYQRIS